VSQEDWYEVEGVPSWLETPATTMSASLLTVTRPQLLPLNDLTWENFERLCLRYVRTRGSVVRAQLYGVKGQPQHGIDIYIRLAEPARYEVYQSKKLESLTAGDIANATDKFIRGKWFGRSKAFRIMTSHEIEDTKIAEAIEAAGTRLEKEGIEFEVLGALQISLWLKDEPRVVDDFFSRAVVEAFCGADAIAKIGHRLNSEQVARYRRELRRFYEVVFNRNDPGIPVRTRIGDHEIPFRDRFVVPDVYAAPSSDVRRREPAGDERPKAVRSALLEGGEPPPSASIPIQQIRVRSDADRWISQAQRSVILGSPGSGKSVLLRILAIELLSEEPLLRETAARWGSLLPVWIPFSYWTDLNRKRGSPVSLSECLRTWFEQFGQSDVWLLVEAAIEDDRLLLLVDGLDEWTDEFAARTTSHLLQTYIQIRNLPAVLVSRPHGFERASIQGPEWQIGDIAPLSLPQQRALLVKWLRIRRSQGELQQTILQTHEIEREADEFIRNLERSKDLAQLAAIPLTLLLLLYLHLQNNPLPASRIEAYEYVTDHFIREHSLARRTAATLTAEQSSLSPEETRKALAYLAYVVQTEFPAGTFSSDDIWSRLEGFLEDEENGLGLSRSESRTALRSFTNIEEGSLGLLVSQGQSLVSFFHRSLQEYLAADYLARTSLSNQEATIRLHLSDRRWREVILAMVLRSGRGDDAAALVEAVDQTKVDSIGVLGKEDLLAEIAFKDSNVPQSRSKSLAIRACGVIETSFVASHRSRLLGHAMFGLHSRKTRGLMQERIKRWIFSRGLWGPGRIQGLRGWPAIEHTWEVLYRALCDEDPGTIREASGVIAHVFGGQIDQGNQVAQLALRSDNAAQRAACVESLSKGWPEHPLLATVIQHARRSVSDAVKVAGLAATVHLGKQEDPDLIELLGLARDYYTSTIDYSWRSEVADTLARGWPKNLRLKTECLRSAPAHYSQPGLIDRAIALFVLVSAFPQDDDVASLVAQELGQRSPFVGSDSIWPVLPSSFRDHPTVVQALDQWVVKGEYHDPIALHHGALVGRTEKMKEALLEGINKWVPFWAVGSLLEGWGISDAQVGEKLKERVAQDDAAEVGQFIAQILKDPTRARDRLLTLLRDPGSRRVDFLMRGFSQLRPLEGETEIVDAALERLGEPTSWTRENYQGSVILTFPNDERVRNLARDSLTSQVPPFAAVAEAYAADAELRMRLGEFITPLSASLRYQIVSELARFAERDFALEVLKDWDTEHNAEVKTEAAIEFHSLLSMDRAEIADALPHLDEMLPCYGPDHEERRQAAAAALIVFKQLERIVGKTETIGHVGRQVNIPVSGGFKRNRVLLNLLGEHWNYVKQALGGNLNILVSHIGSDTLFEGLALAAVEHPQLAREVFDMAETDIELRHSANFLALVGRMEPRSERLVQLCLAVIGENTPRHDWFDSVEVASSLLAEHFEGDAKIEEQLVSLGSPQFIRTGAVMALSLGWPGNEVLRTFAVGALKDEAMDASHLYAKYALLPSSKLAAAVEGDLTWAQTHAHLVDSLIRPLAARLHRDSEVVRALSDTLFSTTNPSVKASFARLVASSSGLTAERDAWCRGELERQNSLESPEFGYDLLAKRTRTVSACLFESLGEVLPVSEPLITEE
jgi:hypothetical protein